MHLSIMVPTEGNTCYQISPKIHNISIHVQMLFSWSHISTLSYQVLTTSQGMYISPFSTYNYYLQLPSYILYIWLTKISIKNTKTLVQNFVNSLTYDDWMLLRGYNLHHLMHFMNIRLDYNFLYGALSFRDPNLHVFCFKEIEKCLPFKEFSTIISVKMNKHNDQTISDINIVVSHAIQYLFGISKNDVDGYLPSCN